MAQFLFKKKALILFALTTVLVFLVVFSLIRQSDRISQPTQVREINQELRNFRFSLPRFFQLVSITESIKADEENSPQQTTNQVVTTLTKTTTINSTLTSQQKQTLAEQVLALTNKARSDNNLPTLKSDPLLNNLAQQRSADMAANNYFSHTDPSWATAYVKLLKGSDVAYKSAAENIGKNNHPDSQTASVVFNTWMQSPGHRNNILNPSFNSIGIGVATNGSGMKYYTQIFVGN